VDFRLDYAAILVGCEVSCHFDPFFRFQRTTAAMNKASAVVVLDVLIYAKS
jgi:hypothetical protein